LFECLAGSVQSSSFAAEGETKLLLQLHRANAMIKEFLQTKILSQQNQSHPVGPNAKDFSP
jgi:hypothetical protein